MIGFFPGGSGLECAWYDIIGPHNKHFVLVSCITLPWACRIIKFGQSVDIHGIKKKVEVCVHGDHILKKVVFLINVDLNTDKNLCQFCQFF